MSQNLQVRNLSDETHRKLKIFRQNRRGFSSFVILTLLLVLSLFAELYANSRPLLIFYQGAFYVPLWHLYPDTTFGGDFVTEADYQDPFIRDQITSGGNWAIYPPIHWDYQTLNRDPALHHPSPPSSVNWLGTDDRGRDVLARLLYGFRISIFFGLLLACLGTALGMLIGAMQGFFGGWSDLLGQRGIELWSALPELYLLILLSATFEPSIPLLLALLSLFGWMSLSAYVRAEFLRARNFDYVRAARAMGVTLLRLPVP